MSTLVGNPPAESPVRKKAKTSDAQQPVHVSEISRRLGGPVPEPKDNGALIDFRLCSPTRHLETLLAEPPVALLPNGCNPTDKKETPMDWVARRGPREVTVDFNGWVGSCYCADDGVMDSHYSTWMFHGNVKLKRDFKAFKVSVVALGDNYILDEAVIKNELHDADDDEEAFSRMYAFRGVINLEARVHSSYVRRMLNWKDTPDWGDLLIIPCVSPGLPHHSPPRKESTEVLWRRVFEDPDEDDEILTSRPLVESALDD